MMKFLFFMMFMLFFGGKMSTKMMMMIIMMIMFIFLFNSMMMISLGEMLGIDNLAGLLIFLTLLIIYLMCMGSNMVWEINENCKIYINIILMMNMILFMIFVSMNALFFFFWFELVLIPMFLLIMGWGVQSERFNASMYMMFYTLFGSLPLILGLMFLYNKMNMNFLMMSDSFELNLWSIVFLLAFLIKLPMYFFHYWLPSAHVEAPVAGSMVLAGVLLKLGGYGIYRFYYIIGKSNLNFYLMSVGMLGGLYSSMMCVRQIDVSALVAYSSIGHMGLLLSGFLSGSMIGYNGGVIMMIGHGLCSSGMFGMMNILYERMHSRSLVIMRGLLMLSPSILFWLFLIMSSNMSAPPSLNLMSELMLMGSMLFFHKSMIIILFMVFMISCTYSLYLFSMVQHNFFWSENKMMSMNLREMLLMAMHWLPLNLMFVKM